MPISATLPCVISAPRVPGYEITGACGRGGFAVVYLIQAVARDKVMWHNTQIIPSGNP